MATHTKNRETVRQRDLKLSTFLAKFHKFHDPDPKELAELENRPAALQRQAERIYRESGGRYGWLGSAE